MVARAPATRVLIPGTTGWSADDLRDPDIARQWDAGRYEIIDGILVLMPPPSWDHGESLPEIIVALRNYLRDGGEAVRISVEVDIMTPWGEVLRADTAMLTPADVEAQKQALRAQGLDDQLLQRLQVAPTLVIESLSRGHEKHDRVVKRDRYARLGVKHYWLVDHHQRSITCYSLDPQGVYGLDTQAADGQPLRPSAFPGFTLDLKDIFP